MLICDAGGLGTLFCIIYWPHLSDMRVQHSSDHLRNRNWNMTDDPVAPAEGFFLLLHISVCLQVIFKISDDLLVRAPSQLKPPQAFVPPGGPAKMKLAKAGSCVPLDTIPH